MTATLDDLTPVLGAPLAEYLSDRIPKEAGHLARSYPRIPKPDFEQGIWLYVLEHRQPLKRLFGEGRHWAVNRRLKDGGLRLIREDERHTRAVKALAGGYSTEDEEFYSTGLLAHVLPALIAVDFNVADAMDRTATGTDAAGIHIRSNDPFGGAENYQVMLIDISTAWKRLTEGQRRLLRVYYSASQEDTQDGRWERQQLASSMGLTEETLRQRAHRALRALSGKLGGENPWQ